MDARKTYSFACPCCAFQTLTEQPIPTRRALVEYVRSLKNKKRPADAVTLAKLIDADSEAMIADRRALDYLSIQDRAARFTN